MTPRNIVFLLVAILGLQALGSADVFAAAPKPPKPPRAPAPNAKKATPEPTHTTIRTISADSITVAEPKGTKTYKITKSTEFELRGQKVKIDELKAGMRVSVTVGSDPTVAERISASDAPTDAPAANAKGAK